MSGIKKSKPSSTSAIQKTDVSKTELLFSFRLFDATDADMCPEKFPDGYTQTLMERLKGLSTMRVGDFCMSSDKALRVHRHDWPKTARPKGFGSLNAQFRDHTGWQFCLSANQHGRVHGILIGATFFVIWLDVNHALYP